MLNARSDLADGGTTLARIATCGDAAEPDAPVGPAHGIEQAAEGADAGLPDYLEEIYHWAYLNPRNVRLLDRELVVRLILWFQHGKLQHAAFSELEAGQRVLVPAHVYGDFCLELARHLGPRGCLDIFDVAPIQVRTCRAKTAHLPQVRVARANAAAPGGELYAAVCCYFLLHEVPLEYKHAIVRQLLGRVHAGGKVVFVDYHRPHWAHPLKPVTSLVFDRLEPFAKELWSHEIEEFAGADPRFTWRKETYFGGLYQKVVARRVETA